MALTPRLRSTSWRPSRACEGCIVQRNRAHRCVCAHRYARDLCAFDQYDEAVYARDVQDLQKGGSMKTLAEVEVGDSATVVKLHGDGALRRHLMDLGLIKGTPFKVVKVAPLGDPVEITVRGYELSIRKEEAAIVEVA